MGQRMDAFETRASSPAPAPAAPAEDEVEAEITLRKNQLGAIRRGEIDASYEPEVQAALAGAVSRKEGRTVVQRESVRNSFVSSYNAELSAAYKDFPELTDPNSELAKETLALLARDSSYMRVQRSISAKGRDAEKIDFSSLDPGVTRKVAAQAFVNVQRRNAGKPLSQQQPNPKLSRTGLEGGGGSNQFSGETDLDKLETQARDSGNWIPFIKAREAAARRAKES